VQFKNTLNEPIGPSKFVIIDSCDHIRNNKMGAFCPLILELGGRFKKGMSLYAGFYRKSIPNEKYVLQKYF